MEKAFVTAQLTAEGLEELRTYADVTLGGWGATGKKLTPEELVEQAAECGVLVICYEEINDYVLDHLPKLRFIACSRGGVENIDREAVRRHDVWVSSAPGRNANAVAELTVGLMLCALRHIPKTHHYIMSRQWDRVPWDMAGNNGFKTFDGYELDGKTVGFVGYGAVARKVDRKLSGFEVRKLAYDPYCAAWPDDVKSVAWEELLERSDIITLHAKLTDQTRGMVDEAAIARMKPGAILINTARGALVDEDALCRALRDRRIACAALDAQIHEPMPHDSPFLELDNIILTPHIGGASRDMIAQQTRIVMEDVRAYFQQGRPVHVVR